MTSDEEMPTDNKRTHIRVGRLMADFFSRLKGADNIMAHGTFIVIFFKSQDTNGGGPTSIANETAITLNTQAFLKRNRGSNYAPKHQLLTNSQ